ncbi:MAG: PAS domain S-box protein [Promethearchaeota archaeon]
MALTKKEIRKKFKDLLENPHYFVFVYDLDGIIIDVNNAMLSYFGYIKEEIIDTSFGKYINKQDLAMAFRSIEQFKRTKTFVGANTYRIRKKDGTYVYLDIFGIPIKNATNNVAAIIALGYDVTKFKIAEQQLKESEQKFRTIADQSLIGIVILQDNIVKYANQKFADISGYSLEEIFNWDPGELFKIVHPKDKQKVAEQAIKKMQGDSDIINHYNFIGIKKDGNERIIEIYSKSILFENQIADLIIVNDVTEKYEAEKKVKESERKYQSMIHELDIGFFKVSLDGSILVHNLAFNKIFGIEESTNLIGEMTHDLWVNNEDRVSFMEELMKNGVVRNMIVPAKKVNGESIFLLGNTHLIMDESGKSIASEGTFLDITEKINLERKLQESEEKYKNAYIKENFYKDLFAHDMNNILQNMIMMLDLSELKLGKIKQNKTLMQFFQDFRDQIERATSLVKNVNKFSQLDESTIKLEKINLKHIFNRISQTQNTASKGRTINLNINIQNDEITIMADEFILDAFVNLINNTIKYNNNLEICIEIKASIIQKEGLDFIKVEVIDNGRGIPDSKKKSLFTMGIKEDRSVKGMGLGLSLVKTILDRYNAKIYVEDNVLNDITRGSNFIILFPRGA